MRTRWLREAIFDKNCRSLVRDGYQAVTECFLYILQNAFQCHDESGQEDPACRDSYSGDYVNLKAAALLQSWSVSRTGNRRA